MGTQNRKRHGGWAWAALAVMALLPLGAWAQDMLQPRPVYDVRRGELSPGTQAPTTQRMVNAIRSASPSALTAMLEYGERVECYECIPLLEARLLDSDEPETREIAAWWLRRRPFGYGRAAVAMREAVLEDDDPVRRARAAEALGEFLDVRGLPALQQAAMDDAEAGVRKAAVQALGRLNAVAGNTTLAAAMGDEAAEVRLSAVTQVLRVNFFEDHDALLQRLGDEDPKVRLRAAQVVGELQVAAGSEPLQAMLDDDAPAVRQAAAWALGRVGGDGAGAALRAAEAEEEAPGVRDAIEVALRMLAR
jgi:HEAT repeat protein